MSKVGLVIGDNGTGKTTFALSGRKPVDYYEFDAGSFERASVGLNLTEGDVNFRSYYAPLTNLLEPGRISVSERGGMSPATVHRLEGWDELWWEFVKDYLKALQGPGYPIIDTETKLWLLIRQGFLEEAQDAVGDEKERLDRLQYTEPNARHSQIIEAAQIARKDLVMLAHEKEQYLDNKPTGKMIPDGFKEAANLSDYVLRFQLESNLPVATIMKAGTGGLGLIGMKLPQPTLESVNLLLDSAAKIRRAGLGVPNDPEMVIATAEAL